MRLDFWHKWGLNDGQLMLALVAACFSGIVAMASFTFFSQLDFGPPAFKASVVVLDQQVPIGGDPLVQYDRTAMLFQKGTWVAELQIFDDGVWRDVCQGGGASTYDGFKTDVWRLSYYMGREPCLGEPGQWRIVTTWSLFEVTEDETVLRIFSNISPAFEVVE
jgi:hypothetical protein